MRSIFGIPAERLLLSEEEHVRALLNERLVKAMKGCPKNPLAHGKCVAGLWNYFPQEFEISEDEWLTLFLAYEGWYLLRNIPNDGAYITGEAKATEVLMPNDDYFLFNLDQRAPILATSHEIGFGPWAIGAEAKATRIDWGPIVRPSRIEMPGQIVDKKEARKVLTWLTKRLRRKRGVNVPSFKLVPYGPAEDYMWNYIDFHYDVTVDETSFAHQTFMAAHSLFAWNATSSDAWIVDQDRSKALRTVPDAYYLDWPEKRWLLAMPGEYVKNNGDSWMDPSFVILD